MRHIREHSTRHFFATLTSGFTAVTNAFMLRQCRKLKAYLGSETFQELAGEKYFDPANQALRNRDVWHYLDGVAADSAGVREDGEMRRLYRNLAEVYEEKDLAVLPHRIDELIELLRDPVPGQEGPGPHPAPEGHVPRVGGGVPVGLLRLERRVGAAPAPGLLHGGHLHRGAHAWSATSRPCCACCGR